MTVFRMLLAKVDPFAVFHAERELGAIGVQVSRDRLVAHYLVQGQLRTLVERFQARPDAPVDQVLAEDLAHGLDEAANPRFVAPFRLGLVFSASALGAIAVAAVPILIRWGRLARPQSFPIMAAILAGAVAVCFAYTYLGALVGQAYSRNTMMVVLLLVLVGVVVWVVGQPDGG